MRIARLTSKGIMVDTQQLHRAGPVEGAMAMFKSMMGEIEYRAVQYDNCAPVHLVVDPPNDDISVLCGLPTEGNATMWEWKDKKITCKNCIRKMKILVRIKD